MGLTLLVCARARLPNNIGELALPLCEIAPRGPISYYSQRNVRALTSDL